MPRMNLAESIKVDLMPNRDTKKQIIEILNEHPDWYLSTYFHRKWYSNYQHSTSDTTHIVAEFNTKENCIPIERNDGIRWGLTKIKKET